MGCGQSKTGDKGFVLHEKALSGPTGKSPANEKPDASAGQATGENGAVVVAEQQTKAGLSETNIAETKEEVKVVEPPAEEPKKAPVKRRAAKFNNKPIACDDDTVYQKFWTSSQK